MQQKTFTSFFNDEFDVMLDGLLNDNRVSIIEIKKHIPKEG
jgi:hypothetical protein